jgi:hypothetical protein
MCICGKLGVRKGLFVRSCLRNSLLKTYFLTSGVEGSRALLGLSGSETRTHTNTGTAVLKVRQPKVSFSAGGEANQFIGHGVSYPAHDIVVRSDALHHPK